MPVSVWLGSLYERQGKWEEARKVYQEALAWLYAEQGRGLDRALSLAQRAKEVLPEDPWISDTLGWIFYRKGLYPTAIRLLREAVEQAPRIRRFIITWAWPIGSMGRQPRRRGS